MHTTNTLDRRDVLNLGCGRKHLADAVNLDVTPVTNPDIVHDLNVMPWPFKDNYFNKVVANDVIEHLENVIVILEEMHRVCVDGAVIRITAPHYSCANTYTDPTHRHAFAWNSLDYFIEGAEFSFYTAARFRYRVRKMIFHPTLINRIVSRLANRFPIAYERRWAWMFPAWFLYFEMEVIKESK